MDRVRTTLAIGIGACGILGTGVALKELEEKGPEKIHKSEGIAIALLLADQGIGYCPKTPQEKEEYANAIELLKMEFIDYALPSFILSKVIAVDRLPKLSSDIIDEAVRRRAAFFEFDHKELTQQLYNQLISNERFKRIQKDPQGLREKIARILTTELGVKT